MEHLYTNLRDFINKYYIIYGKMPVDIGRSTFNRGKLEKPVECVTCYRISISDKFSFICNSVKVKNVKVVTTFTEGFYKN